MHAYLFVAVPLYVAIDATAQGKIAWLLREWVPVSAQGKVSFALHGLCPALFVILAMVLALLTKEWRWPMLAGLLRLALFDPVFAWSRGDKLFSVGTSALLDRRLTPTLSAALRLLALAGAAALLITWP